MNYRNRLLADNIALGYATSRGNFNRMVDRTFKFLDELSENLKGFPCELFHSNRGVMVTRKINGAIIVRRIEDYDESVYLIFDSGRRVMRYYVGPFEEVGFRCFF